MADLSQIMRVRCSDDGKTEGTHLAVDVRLPLSLSAMGTVLSLLSRCPCGASMVIRYDDTPAIGGAP